MAKGRPTDNNDKKRGLDQPVQTPSFIADDSGAPEKTGPRDARPAWKLPDFSRKGSRQASSKEAESRASASSTSASARRTAASSPSAAAHRTAASSPSASARRTAASSPSASARRTAASSPSAAAHRTAGDSLSRPAAAHRTRIGRHTEPYEKLETIIDPPVSAPPRRHNEALMRFPAPETASQARTQRDVNRELLALRGELKRHVKGKPSRPNSIVSIPAVIGRGIGRFIKVIALILVLCILFAGSTGVGMLLGYISTTDPVPLELLRSGTQTTKIYDAKNNLIAKYTGEQNIDREPVKLADVDKTYIVKAFIAIEDERFLTNIGIDPRRIMSAVASALANGGNATHGGSTITQQVVKLATGNNQLTAQRKVQEWYKAVMLTQSLSKDEIIETYLNLVPMGNSYVGIQAASIGYFNKPASQLTLAESAYLAGIPRGPSLYNPRTESGLRNGLRRQRIVLGKMFELKMITQEQYRQALNEDLVFRQTVPKVSGTSINSYYADYLHDQVIEDLVERKNYSYQMASYLMNSGGLSIYSTQEPEVQKVVDSAFNNQNLYMKDPDEFINSPEKPQAGEAVINNKTYAIAALGGGVGEKKANFILNHATDIQRQPGSAIKPIGVYGPAINERKVTGATVFEDKPVYLDPDNPNTPWPENYGGRILNGPVTVRNALKLSLNIEAVLTLQKVGVDKAKEYLYKMGIDRRNDPVELALALGALEHGVSPLQMAGAFATFPNSGLYTKPYAYTKVVNNKNEVLLSNTPKRSEVFTPETAYMISDMLKETVKGATSSFGYVGLAYDWGPIHNANGEEIISGCKSGTSGTAGKQMDHWFCGYTPYYTAAVWYGFDIPRPIEEQDLYSPENIYFDTMNKIHANLAAVSDFNCPNTIIKKQICIVSGLLASPYCPGNDIMTESFDINSPLTPTALCNVHYYVPPATTAKPEVTKPKPGETESKPPVASEKPTEKAAP